MKFEDIGYPFRWVALMLVVGATLKCAAGQLTVNVDAGTDGSAALQRK